MSHTVRETRLPGWTVAVMVLLVILVILMGGAIALLWSQIQVEIRRQVLGKNELSALGVLHSLYIAETKFQASCYADSDKDGVGDYGTLEQLLNLDGMGKAPALSDTTLGAGEKNGYVFTVVVTQQKGDTKPAYRVLADPLSPGRTGYLRYYLDESGIIRYTADGTLPTVSSTPVEQGR
ncbi:MAG: hypothetical protein HZB26_19885 [Candidatus Hydrogenedentes bacterium]|nr:hypothetical protein [Candidatus Hydrogenedentota bacterium]